MKVTEIKPSRECPREAVDLALQKLQAMRVESSGNFVQVFSTPHGFDYKERTGAACHAGLGEGIPTGWEREAVGLYYAPKEAIKPFYDWFIERSFASRFVVGRNSKGFVVDADIPPELLQNIAIISRHHREIPNETFKMFEYIVSKGFREETAYVCAMNSGFFGRPKTEMAECLKYPVGDAQGGHRAWRMFPLTSLKMFLEDDFGEALDEFAKRPSGRHRATIYGGISLCGAGPDLSKQYCKGVKVPPPFTKELMTSDEHQEFRDRLKTFRTVGPEMYRPPNPFVRSTIPPQLPDQMSFGELIEVALPYLKEKGFSV